MDWPIYKLCLNYLILNGLAEIKLCLNYLILNGLAELQIVLELLKIEWIGRNLNCA